MNDKIKELLKNAEQSDAIAINKWRIENREQLRKERKEKLKELMEKDKQETAVEWLESQLLKQKSILKNHFEEGKWNDDRCSEIDNCLEFVKQAKEMEKQKMIEFAQSYAVIHCMGDITKNAYEYYYETYGDDKQ